MKKWRKKNMTFQFKVYYEDDSRYGYGKKRHKFIRARSKAQAVAKFKDKYGIDPIDVV
jgi:glutamate racemase